MLQQQQKYIDGKLKERDAKFVASLRETQEERRIEREERRLFLQEVAARLRKNKRKVFGQSCSVNKKWGEPFPKKV